MRVFGALGLAWTIACLTAGCSFTGSGGALPNLTAAAPQGVPPAPEPVVYGAFLDGPVGSKLTQADRDRALGAEQDAVTSGQRKTWKGDHGTFGFVEPAATASLPTADATALCRTFKSTIFLNGRPQVGNGTGCQNPDGSSRIVS